MEIATLVTTVVSLVGGYLLRIGGRVGSRAAEDVDEAVLAHAERLYEAVKERLAGEPYADASLTRLEEEPANERRRAPVEEALEEAAANDVAFRRRLEELLAAAEEAGAPTALSVQASDAGAVAGRDIHIEASERGVAAGRDVGDVNLGGSATPGAP